MFVCLFVVYASLNLEKSEVFAKSSQEIQSEVSDEKVVHHIF